eukprot:949281_1
MKIIKPFSNLLFIATNSGLYDDIDENVLCSGYVLCVTKRFYIFTFYYLLRFVLLSMSPVNTCDPCTHLFIWCTIVLNTILFISTISILISFVHKRSKASPKLPKQLFYSSFAFIIGSSLALLVSMFAITLSIDVCNILFNITCYSFNPPFICLIDIMHSLFSMSIDIFFVQRIRCQYGLVMLNLFLSYFGLFRMGYVC